jgi:hypothetical protein
MSRQHCGGIKIKSPAEGFTPNDYDLGTIAYQRFFTGRPGIITESINSFRWEK